MIDGSGVLAVNSFLGNSDKREASWANVSTVVQSQCFSRFSLWAVRLILTRTANEPGLMIPNRALQCVDDEEPGDDPGRADSHHEPRSPGY